MEEGYQLSPQVRYVRLDDDRGFISLPSWEQGTYVSGSDCDLVEELVQLLHDGATVQELVAVLDAPRQHVEEILEQLKAAGALDTSTGHRPTDAGVTVGLLSAGNRVDVALPTPVERLASPDALASADIEAVLTVTAEERPSFQRAVADHATVPWVPTRVVGTELWLGPVFRPSASPCYDCYERRLLASVADRSVTRAEMGLRATADLDYPSSTVAALTALGVLFVIEVLESPSTAGDFVRLDPAVGEATVTTVISTPGCTACETN